MGRRIVIEYEEDRYGICIEIPAMPGPIKSWQRECFSREELSQAVNELAGHWPELVEYPEKVKKELEKLKPKTPENQFRKSMTRGITGID